MTILEKINNQKTHIIYGVALLLVSSVAYHFFKKEPGVITKTLTKVETKIQTVTKDRIVYVDRTIVTKEKNGTVITEVDHEHSDTTTHKDTKTVTAVTEKTVETFLKNYSIEALYPISYNSGLGVFDYSKVQLTVGTRIFSSPLWIVGGTTGQLNTVLVGLRYEW